MGEVGALYALTKDEEVDSTVRSLPIVEGLNILGRNNSALFTKQVSRKHISITAAPSGTLEIAVEGPNPIVLLSGNGRKKLFPKSKWYLTDGDVIQFIPGELPFKYVSKTTPVLRGENTSVVAAVPLKSDQQGAEVVSNVEDELVRKRKSQVEEDEALARLLQSDQQGAEVVSSVEDELVRKRKSQVEEDEALARLLQEEEDRAARDEFGGSRFSNTGLIGSDAETFTHSTRVDAEVKRSKPESRGTGGASTFQLMHTQAIPRWANTGCIRVQDVIQGDIQLAILSNYMVDVSWLLSVCPLLRRVPQVVMIHGESGQSLELLQVSKPPNWVLFKPPLRLSYGTHHSKAMFLVYRTGVRVIVHTANLIYVDWNNKTQGLWMQDFPLKDSVGQTVSSDFENDLVDYLKALEWPGCTVILPNLGETSVNSNFFRKFDYSSASVRLVASIPGYHRGHNLTKWGHMKLRTVLHQQVFEDQFQGSMLVFQFSSLGSLDDNWVNELATSMSAGSTLGKKPLGLGKVQIVWPTVEDIRCSLEGYAAGNAVPSPEKNVKKEFLKKYWAHWKAEHKGRSRAIPHMKSYVRYSGQSLAWFLLTSSNLSKAAWGALQKNSTQLMIRSYELGVCFLPSLVLRSTLKDFSCTDNALPSPNSSVPRSNDDQEIHDRHGKLVTSCHVIEGGENTREMVVQLPVPYTLPPPPYGPGDVPWSSDCQYKEPDVYGEIWPRRVQLYSLQGVELNSANHLCEH